MVISRPKIWRKVNFCIFLMLESNFWIHWIFFLIFKPYLSQNVKPEKVCGQFLRFFWFVWLMKRDTWIRLSRITIIWDLVIQLQPPPTQSSKCIFYRVAVTKVLWGTRQKIDLIWHWHWVTQLIFIMTLNLVLYLHFVANNSL